MNYVIYKLRFLTPVHFGKKALNDTEYTLGADTLYSALCHEAINNSEDTLEKFVANTKNGLLSISDVFPYMNNDYMLPKPYVNVERTERSGDSIVKKAFKKLKYISVSEIDSFVEGAFDVTKAISMKELGVEDLKISVSIRGLEETLPYEVGYYVFNEGNGLYFLMGYQNDEQKVLFDTLIESLSYSGIGGKRNSGYGRFEYECVAVPELLLRRLNSDGARYMALSVCLPTDNELDEVLSNAQFSVVKRSGFVASSTYSPEQTRKNDLYLLASGSCFDMRFAGDVYDVSSGLGTHPVYRYAKPIFMEISV